jgi:hypothetical protein
MKLLQLSMINDQFIMINLAAKYTPADVCKLLNENSMKIVNCKLKITPEGSL